MVDTIKFSEMTPGGDLAPGKKTPGLDAGINVLFNNPWTFLAPGTTGDRPPPVAAMYYRLRFNTTLEIYEYYDPTIPLWVELSGSGTGTVNPGVANDIAFYAASGQAVSPIAGAANAVLISNGSKVPSMSTTLPSGLSIPGAIITASLAALLSGSVVAAPAAGNDLVNKTYADNLFASGVTSLTGTTNQVIFSASTGAVTASLPQDIALGSTPTFAGLTLSSIPLGSSSGGTGINNGGRTLTLAGNLATSGAFASTFTMTGATNVTFPTSGTLATTAGTVSSVTGTANRITSTGGTTPVIDISAAYVGQTSITTLGTIATGVWQGTLLSPTYGGTGVNNGASTLTLGGNLTTSGAFASTFTMTAATSVTFPTSGTLATTSQLVTPAALTKTDDTNVTLTLGGSPSTALVNAASLTLGWTGTLSGTRGGTGVNNGSSTATYAGNLNFASSFATSGAFGVTQTYTGITNVTFPTSGTLATTSQLVTPSALTKTDDTNVTLTLGGSPSTALVNAASLTLGWTGTLSGTRGGTGVNNGTSTITIGGNVAFSGAFTFTGTITGNTTVTFPTTGTLLTSAGAVTSLTGTANQITASASTGAVTVAIASNIVLPGTGGFTLPTGNTAARAGAAGTMRFNSQTSVFEATVDGSAWATIETSATGVTSVSGTTNRITSTGGTTPVIDISASYVGQSSITTLGTITTGVWTGTTIAVANGGTGITSFGTGVATALGQNVTGSGGIALATSPTFVTPTLGAASASSLTFTTTTELVGTTTNNNAAAGSVGEYISSNIAAASAISITSATPKNLTSITLTAGDWQVWGNLVFFPAASTSVNGYLGGISSVSATFPDSSLLGGSAVAVFVPGAGSVLALNTPTQRFSLTGNTIVYVVGFITFSVSTMTFCGGIYARRLR